MNALNFLDRRFACQLQWLGFDGRGGHRGAFRPHFIKTIFTQTKIYQAFGGENRLMKAFGHHFFYVANFTSFG